MAGKEPEEQPSVFDPESSAGLFVGISTFEDERFLEVPYAVDDAVDLAYLFVAELRLVRPEKAILLLAGEPRKPQSANKLGNLMELGTLRRGARHSDIYEFLSELTVTSGPQGLVLLTVATHGISDQGFDVLVASDSRRNHMVRTGVAVSDLFNEVAGARAERRLVLLDACRERLTQGTRGVEDSPMAPSFADAIAQAKGSVILSGATLGGFAYDDTSRQNGVFTAAILDGLAGQAPAGRDGWITVRTLADYVQQRVVVWVQRNRPEHASKSLGIGRQIESTADSLPLALHPQASAERSRYRLRREAALEQAKRNQGHILTGALWDLIAERLPIESPGPEAGPLLDEIEALDGTERSQRSLRDFLRESTTKPIVPPVAEQNRRRVEKGASGLFRQGAARAISLAYQGIKFIVREKQLRELILGWLLIIFGIYSIASIYQDIVEFFNHDGYRKVIELYDRAVGRLGTQDPSKATVPTAKQAPVPAAVAAPPRLALDTDKGHIVIELDPDGAPKTVNRIIGDFIVWSARQHSFQGVWKNVLYANRYSCQWEDQTSPTTTNKVGRGSVLWVNEGGENYLPDCSLQIVLANNAETGLSVPLGRVVIGMEVVDAIAAQTEENSGKFVGIRKVTLLASTAVPH